MVFRATWSGGTVRLVCAGASDTSVRTPANPLMLSRSIPRCVSGLRGATGPSLSLSSGSWTPQFFVSQLRQRQPSRGMLPLSRSARRFSSSSGSSNSNPAAPEKPESPAAEPAPPKKLSFSKRIRARLADNREQIRTYTASGAVVFASYLVFRTGFHLVNIMNTASYEYAGEVAFTSGILAAAVIAGACRFASQYIAFRPELMYRQTLEYVKAHPAIPEHLGTDIQAGAFRVHSFRDGGFKPIEKLPFNQQDFAGPTSAESDVTIAADNDHSHGWLQYLRPRRMQLAFHIRGSKGHAMVNAEIERELDGGVRYYSLSVSPLDGDQRLILSGEESTSVDQNLIRWR